MDARGQSQGPSGLTVSYERIVAAAARIAPILRPTPVLRLPGLDADLAADVFVKAELFHAVGSYKARGALNAVLGLGAEADRGVLTHSSGNHGIALAWAATARGIASTVVIPEGTDARKVERLQGYGAKIVWCPPGQREPVAERELERTGAVFIHPYEHLDVVAGHGTAALELFAEVPDLDIVVTPIGGGGLLASTAIVAEAVSPGTRCIGAEPLAVDDAHRSLRTGLRQKMVENPTTVATAVLGRIGEHSFDVLTRLGADVLTVTEAEILAASRFFLDQLKLVVEPSAATTLALARKLPLAGRRVALVVSGGNTDLGWYR